MIDRDDLKRLVGGGGVAGAVADVLLTGGDVLIALVVFVADSIEVWLALASQVLRLSDRVEWIPEGTAEGLLAIVASLFVVITVGRLLSRAWSRINTDTNN